MPLELREPIAVDTPQGSGYVLFVEFDNHDNWWTVVLNNTPEGKGGALVTFPQDQVRVARSYSHGRGWTHESFSEMLKGSGV